MRGKRLHLAGGVLTAAVALAGCDADLDGLVGRVNPSSPELQASVITGRYLAGEYPGTINSTLDDLYVVYHFTYANGVTLWALVLLHEQTGSPALLAEVQTSLAKYDRD